MDIEVEIVYISYIDNYTLFYHKFLKNKPTDEYFFEHEFNSPSVRAWSGLAFERVCLQHVSQIEHALGISGVYTEVNAWSCKEDLDNGIFGSQVDLLIVRKDQVINLCEMKYTENEYVVAVYAVLYLIAAVIMILINGTASKKHSRL